MIICDVDFEIPKGPVGVLCSGGADSSLVLYLLMKYSEHPIHILTMTNRKKQFTNLQVINDVIRWCITHTKNINITHTVKYVEEQTNKELEKFSLENLHKFKTIYIGDTCYPSDEINQQFANETGDDFQNMLDRQPNKNRPTKVGPIYVPFTNYDKRKIAEIYTALGIRELNVFTRSCESFDDIGTEHCGNCWWCKEREWAFDKR